MAQASFQVMVPPGLNRPASSPCIRPRAEAWATASAAQALMEAASVKETASPRWATGAPSTDSSRKSMAAHIILAACSRVRRADTSASRWPFTMVPSVMP